jgi:phosphinothricin acetyltransferase
MNMMIDVRIVGVEDAAELAEIYNQGIDERTATFNTNQVTAKEIEEKIVKSVNKNSVLVAVKLDSYRVIGWASISPYSSRPCYCGIGEVSSYIHKQHRARGVGKLLLQAP